MGLIIKKKPAVASTTVDHLTKGAVVSSTQHQEEVGPAVLLDAPHAMIEVSTSLTTNLGNYNSVKVSVAITLPAQINELDDVFEYGRSWMNSKMELLTEDITPAA